MMRKSQNETVPNCQLVTQGTAEDSSCCDLEMRAECRVCLGCKCSHEFRGLLPKNWGNSGLLPGSLLCHRGKLPYFGGTCQQSGHILLVVMGRRILITTMKFMHKIEP